jgi:hypothetical protein
MSRPVFVVGLIAVCSFFLCHHRPQHRDSCAIRAYAQVRNAAVCSRLVRRAFNVASVMDTSAPAPNVAGARTSGSVLATDRATIHS